MSGDALSAPAQIEPGVVVHRDVFVRTRDGVRLATDIYRPARDGVPLDRPAPVILERTPYGKSITSRREIEVGMAEPFTRAQVAAHFVRHGYVVDLSGLPRTSRLGRRIRQISFGRGGRLRRDGVDRAAALVRRPHRHDGVVLRRAYAACGGVPQSAGPCHDDPRLRWLRERLHLRHQAGRRVRIEAGDMGLQSGA